jgi:hypothetical protein
MEQAPAPDTPKARASRQQIVHTVAELVAETCVAGKLSHYFDAVTTCFARC